MDNAPLSPSLGSNVSLSRNAEPLQDLTDISIPPELFFLPNPRVEPTFFFGASPSPDRASNFLSMDAEEGQNEADQGQLSPTGVRDLLFLDLNETESEVVEHDTLGGVRSHENFPPRELIMGVRWFMYPTGIVEALMKFPVLSFPQQVAAVKAGAECFVGPLKHQGEVIDGEDRKVVFNGITSNIRQPVAGSDGWSIAVRQSDPDYEEVVRSFFGVGRIRQAIWWSSKQPEVRPGVKEKSTWKKYGTTNQYLNRACALYIVLKPEVETMLHAFERGVWQATREKGIGFHET